MKRQSAIDESALQRWARWVLRHLGQRWGQPGLERRTRVELSHRMTRSLGRCYPARRLIRLNAALLGPGQRRVLRETLVHEAAHLASWPAGRHEPPHGPRWRALMERAGYSTRATVPVEQAAGLGLRRRTPRYRHRCQSCGGEFLRRRTDRRWRCAACMTAGRAGELEVFRIAD